jgi:hypothetical protein
MVTRGTSDQQTDQTTAESTTGSATAETATQPHSPHSPRAFESSQGKATHPSLEALLRPEEHPRSIDDKEDQQDDDQPELVIISQSEHDNGMFTAPATPATVDDSDHQDSDNEPELVGTTADSNGPATASTRFESPLRYLPSDDHSNDSFPAPIPSAPKLELALETLAENLMLASTQLTSASKDESASSQSLPPPNPIVLGEVKHSVLNLDERSTTPTINQHANEATEEVTPTPQQPGVLTLPSTAPPDPENPPLRMRLSLRRGSAHVIANLPPPSPKPKPLQSTSINVSPRDVRKRRSSSASLTSPKPIAVCFDLVKANLRQSHTLLFFLTFSASAQVPQAQSKHWSFRRIYTPP